MRACVCAWVSPPATARGRCTMRQKVCVGVGRRACARACELEQHAPFWPIIRYLDWIRADCSTAGGARCSSAREIVAGRAILTVGVNRGAILPSSRPILYTHTVPKTMAVLTITVITRPRVASRCDLLCPSVMCQLLTRHGMPRAGRARTTTVDHRLLPDFGVLCRALRLVAFSSNPSVTFLPTPPHPRKFTER